MNEEKTTAKALSRARQVQPNASHEVRKAQAQLEDEIEREEKLYAARGYGGYIDTQEIEDIRKTCDELVEIILRTPGNTESRVQ